MANGMRVDARMVPLSSATWVTIAAANIQAPSQRPPMSCAAVGKNPVCQLSQLPRAASEAIVGRKYAAMDIGTTSASASG